MRNQLCNDSLCSSFYYNRAKPDFEGRMAGYMIDPYKVLGVAKNADSTQIKKAYRSLAKKYHPDINGDDKEAARKFKEISDAYELVGNEENRKKYDENIKYGAGQTGTGQTKSKKAEQTNKKKAEGDHFKGNFEDQFAQFFGFDPKTKEKVNKTQSKEENPMDTSQLFNQFFKM